MAPKHLAPNNHKSSANPLRRLLESKRRWKVEIQTAETILGARSGHKRQEHFALSIKRGNPVNLLGQVQFEMSARSLSKKLQGLMRRSIGRANTYHAMFNIRRKFGRSRARWEGTSSKTRGSSGPTRPCHVYRTGLCMRALPPLKSWRSVTWA